MAIPVNDNIKVNAPKPSDPRFFAPDNTPWASVETVEAGIPLTERHPELRVDIMGVIYWWKNSAWVLESDDTKLAKGNFVGTAETLNTKIDSILANSTVVNGVTTSSSVPPTGNIHALGIGPGTYPNWDGIVIPANNTGTLQRVDGVYSVSLMPFDLSNYAETNEMLSKIDDSENNRKLLAGINLFIISGYVNKNTGNQVADSGHKCTDYISVEYFTTLKVNQLNVAGAYRQATFFTEKNSSGFISSYGINDNLEITLNSTNIPATAKYVRFNTDVNSTPTIIVDEIRPINKTSLTVDSLVLEVDDLNNNKLGIEKLSSNLNSNSETEVLNLAGAKLLNVQIKDNTAFLDDKQKIISGVDLFTIVGYVKETTRAVVANSLFKCTDFIRYTDLDPIHALQVSSVGAEFRQVMFYADKSDASYLSAWTTNDNLDLILNSSNVPLGTKYIRFNSLNGYVPNDVPVYLDAKIKYSSTLLTPTNVDLGNKEVSNSLDSENFLKLKAGVNLFTIVGYVNQNTGVPDANAVAKRTDYLSLEFIDEIKIENLGVAGAFRQATFFTSKQASGFISSYTADNASTIVLNKSNIPATAKYVVFNTYATKTPVFSLGKKMYKAKSPLNTLIGKASWKYINPTTGYSTSWGQYWDGTQFVSGGVDYFNAQIYPVTAGTSVHIRGWFSGNIPMVVFFVNTDLTTHVANGTKNGSSTPTYYDFYEDVPDGVNFALVQQSRTGHSSPFCEMVVETEVAEKKKKVVPIGDSLSQMAYYADELMGYIKQIDPSYDIYNYGIGGEKTIEIASRVGAFQMFLTPEESFTTVDASSTKRYFNLPATTNTVNIGANSISNSWNDTKLSLLRQNTPSLDCSPDFVFIDGIECLLTWTGSTYLLNRTVAGTVHKVFVGSQMIPKNSLLIKEDDIAILNFSQNGGWTDVNDLVAQYQRVAETLGTKKYIVMSSHYSQDGSPEVSTYIGNRLIQEAALKKAFGAKYVNIREYFCSKAVHDALETSYWNNDSYPTDLPGETHPTNTDIGYMSVGSYAPMFWVNPNNNADVIHISRRSYAIMYKHIFNTMKSLKYFE